jgi:hypothetical protein
VESCPQEQGEHQLYQVKNKKKGACATKNQMLSRIIVEGLVKGTVRRDLTGVESGVNR